MMKRILMFTLCIALGLFMFAPPASANSWGLTGDLLDAVSAVHTWDDYSSMGSQIGDAALMKSRYHNVLMLLGGTERTLYAYSKAVYQPEDGRDSEALLTKTADLLTLSYGSAEWYTFVLENNTYVFQEAMVGSLHIIPHPDSTRMGYFHYFIASDGTDEAHLSLYLPLSDFNISLFPRSVAEVRHLNLMHAAHKSGSDCLGWVEYPERPGALYSDIAKATEPVYTAPYPSSAYRAADGKAAVGLSGDLWALKGCFGEDGNGYVCIRYDINHRTQRIGYIPASVLGITMTCDPYSIDHLIAVPVQAAQDTYLTDDPDVSQARRFSVPAGTGFTCLGLYSNDYAYVSANVDDGKFTPDGQIVWGFVPLKALALSRSAVSQTEAMHTMLGDWVLESGGNLADDELIFHADGRFAAPYLNPETETSMLKQYGTWTVTQYDPAWGLYWNDPPYELTLTYDTGLVTIRGLSFSDTGFSLTNNEGGGGYQHP